MKVNWEKEKEHLKKLIEEKIPFHHIDGNSGNNIIENLRVLCPNCHAMTENFMALNKGKSSRKERYNRREQI